MENMVEKKLDSGIGWYGVCFILILSYSLVGHFEKEPNQDQQGKESNPKKLEGR